MKAFDGGNQMTRNFEGSANVRRLAAVHAALGDRIGGAPAQHEATAFASANIALCKYWGKRDHDLNLPMTNSVSLSLGSLGTRTSIRLSDMDRYWLNGELLPCDSPEAHRLAEYLDLFRSEQAPAFEIRSDNTIPTAAGLASSASAYAALARALDRLFDWRLDLRTLSILARLGSGSAARSVATGFVEWHAGTREDGADSFAEQWPEVWPELRIATLFISKAPKAIGSREAMRRSVETSPLYSAWPTTAWRDLASLRAAVGSRDFPRMGAIAEANALAMHAVLIASRPAIIYWQPETLAVLRQVELLRAEGLSVYATLDAGPNVKLLFLADLETALRTAFPDLAVVAPFFGYTNFSSHPLNAQKIDFA